MASETEKKKISWFKSTLSPQNQKDNTIEMNEEDLPEVVEVIEQLESVNNQQLFSKDNQDKISLDVIVSIENILRDRQLQTYKHQAVVDQLNGANETITRFKREEIKKDQLLQEKNKEIRDLENNLTNKQMSYDQLLEDYKEYQLTSNLEFDKISNQLDTEKAKYYKLYEESTKVQSQNLLKINGLEEQIRNLEIENQKYAEQYEKIASEKAELMKTINDFTEKMSFSFSPKTTD